MIRNSLTALYRARFTLLMLLLSGCAGWSRSCAARNAESFGADWIIVTHSADGRIINCWQLKDVSVTNESNSDGIYWQDGSDLIHLSGWYDRVQVGGGDFAKAAKKVGADLSRCPGGKYLDSALAATPELASPVGVRQLDVPNLGERPDHVVNANFDGGHSVRAVFGTSGIKELKIDGKSVDPDSKVGRAALTAVGY